VTTGTLRTIVGMDLRFHFTRPIFWVLLLALGLVAFGLSSGGLTISSGDSSIGGSKAWVTSEFANGMMFPMIAFLLYSFFIAVAAGMAIPRDDELKVGPLLHSTRLAPGEYIWGKFGAALLLFLGIMAAHLLLTILFSQVIPNANAEQVRGPFKLMNYLRPAVVLALPFVVFLCGISFAIGERTRKPILVFVTPVALFMFSIFFLWEWSPSWLDPAWNRLLMWIEPSGFRWINETWLKVDMGVDYYNHQPIHYDGPFLLSRLVYALFGLGLVTTSVRHFRATVRGSRSQDKARWWKRKKKESVVATGWQDVTAVSLRRPLASLTMNSSVPGFLRTTWDVTRFEARNLRAEPGLYIFVPLILLQTIGSSFFQLGAFDTQLLLTPGVAAVGSMNTLTLLVAFLILIYTVESLVREWHTGLSPIYYSTPVRTAALLAGKALANAIVGVAILLACYLGASLVMTFQGQVVPWPGPFVLVWGLLLVPTFIAWSAFVTVVFAVSRSRYTTYGVGLAAMAFTGWRQFRGEMNWVGNWNLWSSATWSDFAGIDPNTTALLLNRLLWLLVASLCIVVTVQLFPRQEFDSGRILDRLRVRNLLRTGWRLSPAWVPVIAIAIVLGVMISNGTQGGAAERRNEEYRGRNLVTWGEADSPWITAVDIDLQLEPDDHWFSVDGRYEMTNRTDRPMSRFPMSVGDHFREIEWTLNDQPYEPENRARLYVFQPDRPLAPGDTITVGFSHEGRFPDGVTKNGGGMGQFILPSGVVLTSFSSSFVPVPYFEDGRGVDEDNRLSPRDFEEGFGEGRTRPGLGGGSRYSVRTKITGPERFRYHGVGTRESETVEDGRRTVVWTTDHPVNFFNVVAGEWERWDGEGVQVYHHPDHGYNVEEIGTALEAARKYYSEWFYPYPWQELKLSEFAGIAGYAQGFPTNITFSENIGFLTRSTPEVQAAFLVTAHEAAHQWWGNILMPGHGPGGNILSEGMSHFSTILLLEQVQGVRERIEFCKQIEERYGDGRQVDSERALVWTDGSRAGDSTVTYDKGGWAFWMLLHQMGRERGLAGYQDFIRRYSQGDDYPVLQDFLAVMREHAEDPQAFDEFTSQWFLEVVMPEYRLDSVERHETNDGWTVTATVTNRGTGRMPIEVAAVRGERFAEDPSDEEGYAESRVTVTLGAGESETVSISCPFEPRRVLVDPDAAVLMLKRDGAVEEISG
jgi:ABC-2 type transport system permease protein